MSAFVSFARFQCNSCNMNPFNRIFAPPIYIFLSLDLFFFSLHFPAPRCLFVIVCNILSQIGILFVAVPVEVAVFAFAAIRAEALHESSSYPLAAFAVFLSVWTLQVWRLDCVSVGVG